jgi:hypothetical protein
MVRDFQSVIGKEARAMLERTGRLPDMLIGGGQRHRPVPPFLDDKDVQMIGVEAAATASIPTSMPPRSPAGARHPARQQDLSAAGRGRPDHRGALDQRRAGLSRHRAGTQLAARNRPREIRADHR